MLWHYPLLCVHAQVNRLWEMQHQNREQISKLKIVEIHTCICTMIVGVILCKKIPGHKLHESFAHATYVQWN